MGPVGRRDACNRACSPFVANRIRQEPYTSTTAMIAVSIRITERIIFHHCCFLYIGFKGRGAAVARFDRFHPRHRRLCSVRATKTLLIRSTSDTGAHRVRSPELGVMRLRTKAIAATLTTTHTSHRAARDQDNRAKPARESTISAMRTMNTAWNSATTRREGGNLPGNEPPKARWPHGAPAASAT